MRLIVGLIAVVCVGLLAQAPAWAFGGSGARFWFPPAVSSYGVQIDRLFVIILWITGAIFVVVEGALLWFLIRYHHRANASAAYVHGNHRAELIWTIIPALIVGGLTCSSQKVWSQIQGTPPPHQLEIEVKAEQFAWNIRYAGPDGRLGSADDVETINQLHIPVGQVVLVHLKSKDVIHSFFLPQFRIKRDAVPGITGRIWIEATKTGQFEIACAELCGLGHYRMRGFLTIESPEAFQAWLAQAQREQ
ncbi:MAG: cytochrome c oxidase subunit II [Candidatus Omnitrophica bacterium]|nr:cytochrome c oxidase subunit II [Candidatus Omnitrophota bacterium]